MSTQAPFGEPVFVSAVLPRSVSTVPWRCPKSHEPLLFFPRGETDQDADHAFYLCPKSRLRYRVDRGIPVFLIEEATELAAPEVDRLVQRARELGLSELTAS